MTTIKAAREYYETLDAPLMDFVVFENSAHYPQFEEEELFSEWLITTWNSLEEY